MELEVAETGRFAVAHRPRDRPRPAQPRACAASRALHPADGFEFTIRSDIPLSGGLGHERGGVSWPGWWRPTRSSSSAPTCSPQATRAGGPSGQRRRGAARRLRASARTATPTRLEPPAGLEAVLVVPAQAGPHRQGARRAAGARCRCATPCSTSPTPRCSCSASPRGDLDLVARGLDDRLHQPRRAPLYPRSMELVERAASSARSGATISGAGPTVLVWMHYEATGAVARAPRARVARGLGGRAPRAVRAAAAPRSARCERPAARGHRDSPRTGTGAADQGDDVLGAGAARGTSAGRRCERSRPARRDVERAPDEAGASAPHQRRRRASAATSRCCGAREAGRSRSWPLARRRRRPSTVERRPPGAAASGAPTVTTRRARRSDVRATSAAARARMRQVALTAQRRAARLAAATRRRPRPARILCGRQRPAAAVRPRGGALPALARRGADRARRRRAARAAGRPREHGAAHPGLHDRADRVEPGPVVAPW